MATRSQYKAAIASALTDFLADSLTSASVVKYDPFWDFSATAADLEDRLPAVCIRYANGTADDAENPDGLGWVTFWNVIYMHKIDRENEFQYEEALDTIEGLFEQDDYPFPGDLETDGLLIRYCRPESDSTFDELADRGIGGVVVGLAIAYEVYPR